MRPISHRVAEARSLALHREVARRLREDPQVLERARARVRGWSQSGRVAPFWVEAWTRVLNGSLEQVIAAITDPSEEGRALRQTTPFAGAVDARTRWKILREVGDRVEVE